MRIIIITLLWGVTKLTKLLTFAERPTIFFDSHDVSKPDSASWLSILDEDQKDVIRPTIGGELLGRVVTMLRLALDMALFGVDIVVEKGTGHYAIIDINAFPGRKQRHGRRPDSRRAWRTEPRSVRVKPKPSLRHAIV